MLELYKENTMRKAQCSSCKRTLFEYEGELKTKIVKKCPRCKKENVFEIQKK